MNILIPHSWLAEYLDTSVSPQKFQSYLSLCGPSVERVHSHGKDSVYDIEVTTNRVDCMSVFGIAREAAAILPRFKVKASLKSDPFAKPLSLPTAPSVDYLHVKVDPTLCPKFSALLIENVTVQPSPAHLVQRLESVGLRSLNNIIDVSNLLTHALGQPIHMFDYDQIADHSLKLRPSQPQETLVTLDGKTHHLPGGDIVIEDGSGTLIDLCGIMGGLNSSVTSQTKNVLLFVQTYSPAHIRRTSMALSHRTAAATLFEKQLPPQAVLPTLQAALDLILELAGGTPASHILDLEAASPPLPLVKLSQPLSEIASQKMGVAVLPTEVEAILTSLGFTLKSATQIAVPFYRQFDISIPEDLVEEIARIYGYHHIPPVLMTGALPQSVPDATFTWELRIKTALKYFGFTEAYTYSLVSQGQGLKLQNPLSSEWVYLRQNLFASHQEIISENLGRVGELNFFEIASVYLPTPKSLPQEQLRLIVSTSNLDYLRLKGVIEALSADLGIPNFSPQITSTPTMLYWEIALSDILKHATTTKTYLPISKFAPLYEDINVTPTGTYHDLVKQIKSVSPLISRVELQDRYGSKLTLRLTYHSPSHQLSSSDIAPIRAKLDQLINTSS